MQELALNILDIVENSVKAQARLIEIDITAIGNTLTIEIRDDGIGMAPEFLARVTDPFTTTRVTRKVGMGIPLFKMAAEMSGGDFSIESEEGKGTKVRATFMIDSIDRPPLGDLSETMVALLSESEQNSNVEYILRFKCDDNVDFIFDTRELKEQLGGIPVDTPEVLVFVRDFIKENTTINRGANPL
ncbi:MAG: sensor histidine kinase [Clostridiales bacterium]|nr:sensor histidine kinase [Clostridiales bacterium]